VKISLLSAFFASLPRIRDRTLQTAKVAERLYSAHFRFLLLKIRFAELQNSSKILF